MSTKEVASRRLRLAFLCLLLPAASCAPRVQITAPQLSVKLTPGEADTTLRIDLVNHGTQPFTVCPCIGPPRRYVSIEIYSLTAERKVAFPEILFGEPDERFFTCLRAGEKTSFYIDLRNWRPIWGGKVDPSGVGIDLIPAPGRYRIRALYMGSGRHGGRQCLSFEESAASEWLEVEIAPEFP